MCNQCWYADPPGGKGEPTKDRNWADVSIAYLDEVVVEHGPFYGILGYSQGCPMATVYIANSNITFEKVFLFNGYLPTTHSGLNDTINEASPLNTDALIFGGNNDVFILEWMSFQVYISNQLFWSAAPLIIICQIRMMKHTKMFLPFSEKELMELSE